MAGNPQEFYLRFVKLFKVIVPGPFTPEVAFAALVAALLAARTSFDIMVLQIITSIERAMYVVCSLFLVFVWPC